MEIITGDPSIYVMDHSDFIVCSFMENSTGLKRFDYLVGPEAIMDMTDLEVLDVVPRSSDKQAEDRRSVDTKQSGINNHFVGLIFMPFNP